MINVLRLALPVVSIVHPNVTITCRKFKSATLNDMGVVQPVFEEFTARGQVQIDQASEQKTPQNISVARRSIRVWINAELHTVESQQVADQIVWKGKTWNVTSVADWNPGNGWGSYSATEDKYGDVGEGEAEGGVEVEGESVGEEVKGGLKW